MLLRWKKQGREKMRATEWQFRDRDNDRHLRVDTKNAPTKVKKIIVHKESGTEEDEDDMFTIC